MIKLFCTILLLANAGSAFAAELRGAWVTAWNPGFLTPQQADATIAAAKEAGLTTLFIQVRKQADAYYNSTIEPRAPELAPDYDPLAYVTEKARAAGIKVHAWVNVFRVWRSPTLPTDANRLVNLHPDWLNKTADGKLIAGEGYYCDPGIPEVREHNAAVIAEIVRNYDLDGIHLDYIRYPGSDFGYSDTALARYCAETGAARPPDPSDAKWADWRRRQVTEQVRLIRQRVHSIKPKLVITAATIVWGKCTSDFGSSAAYAKVFQDWRSWLEAGLIDASCPMNYTKESTASGASQFRGWLPAFARWDGGRRTFVGIGVYLNTPAGVVGQIEAVRKAKLDGFVLFSFDDSPTRSDLVKALKRTAAK